MVNMYVISIHTLLTTLMTSGIAVSIHLGTLCWMQQVHVFIT